MGLAVIGGTDYRLVGFCVCTTQAACMQAWMQVVKWLCDGEAIRMYVLKGPTAAWQVGDWT